MNDRLLLQAQNISSTELVVALQQKQWPDLAQELQQITEICELALFSPLQLTDDREQLLIRANNFMDQLDSRIN